MASVFTPAQISLYESYISLPSQYHQKNRPALTLDYLTSLHVHQISAIPYENLLLHYSSTHQVSVDPQVVFDKIVTNARGRGGYCMEVSVFYNHVLRALGFQVYMTGVRVRPRVDNVPKGDYMGLVHIVNIVTLPTGHKYMVDVGFGGDGATLPIPLEANSPVRNLGSQEIQLLHEPIPQQSDRSRPMWIYQYRNGPGLDWNSFYCFGEDEFIQQDFEIMNYYTSTSTWERNFQTKSVLAIRFLRGVEDGIERIAGKRMLLDGVVKENSGGKTRVVKVCETEEERVEVLREFFGILLNEEEIGGVKGRNVELKGKLPN